MFPKKSGDNIVRWYQLKPKGRQGMSSTGLIAKVLSKRTEELISPMQEEFSFEAGVKPLPDNWLYVKLTRFGPRLSPVRGSNSFDS
ncbi:hypothetical protein QUA54_17890 [Microcoleus sp. MOSTC5]|uniref:hypothetical protein n=1 Tax=Microcoleus sp. MOSTC5 TaxID=3055378 RepID=UPI002FD0A46A